MEIKIKKLKFHLIIAIGLFALFSYVNAQEDPNCVEMVIDGAETMQVCEEDTTFNIDGEQERVKFKTIYSKEYFEELIKSQKYVVPLDNVGFNPDKTPKTYLVSYNNSVGCIASNRIEYEGKPANKTEICFCELDLDRNIADISYKYKQEDISSISASQNFFENNKCDVYIPNEISIPTSVPITSPDPVQTVDPSLPQIPGEPDISQCLINEPVTLAANSFLFPLSLSLKPTGWSGVTISQNFGKPTGDFGYSTHTGIDLAYPKGVPIIVTKDGVVEAALTGWNDGYGNLVIIKHSVNNKKYYSYYAHMLSISVNQGSTVTAGQQLGQVDNTGNSTGSHLHFEIRECASESTIRTSCVAIDPKPLVIFSTRIVEPKYDQACLEKLKAEAEKTPDLPPVTDTESLVGKKFECAFLKVSDALDRTIPAEFIYAVTRHESGGLNCTNNPNQSVPCTIESLKQSSRAYDNGFKVSGLSQFYYATFESVVKNFPTEMDKCIASMGAELSKITDSKKLDPLLSAVIQQKYSRHITAHSICATGILLRNYGTDWKTAYKGTYVFQVSGSKMGTIDWYNVIGKNFDTSNNRFTDSQNISYNGDNLNPMEFAAYRYHGGNGCSTTKTLRDIYPTVEYYKTHPTAGNVSAFNAYCGKVNTYYNEARVNKIFDNCV